MSLDDLLYGSQTTMKHFLMFYGIFTVLGLIARWILKSSVHADRDSSVMDFVVTFELYACELGHSYVLYRYGPQGYIFAIGVIGILHAVIIFFPVLLPGSDGDICTRRLTGNPLSHFLYYMRCPAEKVSAVRSRVGIQLLAALLCHPIAVISWKHITNECNMQNIQSMHCSLIGQDCRFDEIFFLQLCAEILGSMFLTLIALQSGLAIDVACDIVKLFVVLLVLLNDDSIFSVHLNPAFGLSELFSCDHVNIFRRLALYCVGPVVGVTLAVKLVESMSTNDGSLTGCDRSPSSACDKTGAGRFLMVQMPKSITQKICNDSQPPKTDYCAAMSNDCDPCNAYSSGNGNDSYDLNHGNGGYENRRGSDQYHCPSSQYRGPSRHSSGPTYPSSGPSNQSYGPSNQSLGTSNQSTLGLSSQSSGAQQDPSRRGPSHQRSGGLSLQNSGGLSSGSSGAQHDPSKHEPSHQSSGDPSLPSSGGLSSESSRHHRSLKTPPPRLPRASPSPSRKKKKSPASSKSHSKEHHSKRKHTPQPPQGLVDQQHNRFISQL